MNRRLLPCLLWMSAHSYAWGQAAVEYALKSATSAAAGAGGDAGVAGCRLDSGVLSCLGHTYPKATIIVVALLALLLLRFAARRIAH